MEGCKNQRKERSDGSGQELGMVARKEPERMMVRVQVLVLEDVWPWHVRLGHWHGKVSGSVSLSLSAGSAVGLMAVGGNGLDHGFKIGHVRPW